jgi:hypothetical protein
MSWRLTNKYSTGKEMIPKGLRPPVRAAVQERFYDEYLIRAKMSGTRASGSAGSFCGAYFARARSRRGAK